jgi:hypothetical protein
MLSRWMLFCASVSFVAAVDTNVMHQQGVTELYLSSSQHAHRVVLVCPVCFPDNDRQVPRTVNWIREQTLRHSTLIAQPQSNFIPRSCEVMQSQPTSRKICIKKLSKVMYQEVNRKLCLKKWSRSDQEVMHHEPVCRKRGEYVYRAGKGKVQI